MSGPTQRAKWESLWQSCLAKQRQQPLVILIARESKDECWHYAPDAKVRLLSEAILHSRMRFLSSVQSRSRSRPNDRAIQMQSRTSHPHAFLKSRIVGGRYKVCLCKHEMQPRIRRFSRIEPQSQPDGFDPFLGASQHHEEVAQSAQDFRAIGINLQAAFAFRDGVLEPPGKAIGLGH